MDALSSSAIRALRLLGDERVQARVHDRRARAGVLPDRRAVLLRAPRPGHHRPHAVRRQAAEGPRARRPLLRLDPRARARLHDGDRDASCAKLGVPVKTRHNEVAPGQYEIAPIFENSNVGSDHQQLTMQMHAERRPQLRPRLPAAREAVRRRQRLGQAQQLVDGHRHRHQPARPGRHPGRQPQLPVLLRGGDPGRQQAPGPAAGLGRQHRPGPPPRAPTRRRRRSSRSSSAPSSTRSSRRSSRARATRTPRARSSSLGTPVLPALPMHGGDRNRTSPFAFTGNKFEFRALGSSMSLAFPNTVLNTIVAEAIDDLADKLEAKLDAGVDAAEAVVDGRQGRLRGQQGDLLRRRQLRRGLARRGRGARAEEPARRRPTRCPRCSPTRPSRPSRSYDVLSKRELESPLRGLGRAVRRSRPTSRPRRPHDDREDDDPARRPAPPRALRRGAGIGGARRRDQGR